MNPPELSVVIPTHNPHWGRFQRTLSGLHVQTLEAARWELVVVDNASARFPAEAELASAAGRTVRLVHEPAAGLTHARVAGLRAARGSLVVFVDDDNILSPDYLAHIVTLFSHHPRLGAAGGKSAGEFEILPALWVSEFFDLLALRDLGDREEIATRPSPAGAMRNSYPRCAPIGAGLALRSTAAQAWLDALVSSACVRPVDRTGRGLSSGGDNDIVFTLLRAGWDVGYFPQLQLTHLIPASRLEPAYLARLNRGIQRSWVEVLALHNACTWPPIARWTVPLRVARAFVRAQAWRSPAHRIRWQGLRGRFEGQAAIHRLRRMHP